MEGTRLGVLAFGDSITNAGGELQWGVALQSWALWVARGLGLPFTGYAVDGATARLVVEEQIPAFQTRSARPEARYDVGCLFAGVNDVRQLEWDAGAFATAHEAALRFLADRCDRVLTATVPRRLGIPPTAPRRIEEANEAIRAGASRCGALVMDLGDVRARNHMMADRVHPTAFGQIAIAERALAVLAQDGIEVRLAPASLISWETTRWGRLRGDATYAYRSAKQWGRAGALLARGRLLGP